MRNFDGHFIAVVQVGGSKDGRRALARDDAVDSIVVQLIAGITGDSNKFIAAIS